MDNLNQLEKRRKFVGMSVKEMCQRLKVTPPTYRAWRKNPTIPRIKNVREAINSFIKDKGYEPIP
jgi:transcriptional regulator with XRE-family HTH domain